MTEFVAYRERNGVGDPVGYVEAENKTQAAKLAREKFGPGTYNCTPSTGKEPAWLRVEDPQERARLERKEFDRHQEKAYEGLRRKLGI
jgi:hypothetical protein